MEVRFTPFAHEDIRNIYNYVLKDGETTAQKQVISIYDSIESLGEFPNMGASLQKFVVRSTKLRYLVINKVYIVIYDVTDAVDVIRVFRKEQDFINDLGISD